jgi:hypothetical protein
MAPRRSTVLALLLIGSPLGLATFALDGCASSTSDTGGAASDAQATEDATATLDDASASSDAPSTIDAKADAGDAATSSQGKGETCIGFAKGPPCGAGGLPDYGYVCFNGSPPGLTGCVLATSTGSFGDTYCCPENTCVAQPDQDKECKAAGTPHRYQCPPNGVGSSVAPPVGCADAGGGGTALERFYCCP